MERLPTLSVFLGYTSITCWLGAQFPQILENIQRQSCDGLALPFLANWFLGDLSNLIGCILTHQLPFQTYLAAYFVCVDFMLLSQYVYYRRPVPPPPHQFRQARSRTGTIRGLSMDRGAPRYRTLSAVSTNIAAAAALAAQQDEQADPRPAHSGWQRDSVDLLHESSGSRDTGRDEDDDDSHAVLAESFHSEGGRDSRRKRISWSTERLNRRGGSVGRSTLGRGNILHPAQFTAMESPTEHIDSLHRGRPLQRDAEVIQVEYNDSGTQRRSSRAGRQRASLVFLGAWALFGIGSFTNNIPSSGRASVGRVLTIDEFRIPNSPAVTLPVVPISSDDVIPVAIHFDNIDGQILHHRRQDSHPTQPSAERVLGRIFAWLCTTLYLTSRLPQIWKNFVRKSVKGLSMYLFIFAFLGNSFYVASILSSPQVFLPPPTSTEFIKESIPYILGSAGTLVFDITIVTQSLIYRPRRRRQASIRSRIAEEEESGLLSRDALANLRRDSIESAAQPRGRTSSARTVV